MVDGAPGGRPPVRTGTSLRPLRTPGSAPAGTPASRPVWRPAAPAGPPTPRAEPASGAMTTTATGHRATVARCRCGLPAGGDGYDAGADPEPPDVLAVTVLGQVPGVTRWERAADGLWHPARTRYQAAANPVPWEALGLCGDGRRHRVVPV